MSAVLVFYAGLVAGAFLVPDVLLRERRRKELFRLLRADRAVQP